MNTKLHLVWCVLVCVFLPLSQYSGFLQYVHTNFNHVFTFNITLLLKTGIAVSQLYTSTNQ